MVVGGRALWKETMECMNRDNWRLQMSRNEDSLKESGGMSIVRRESMKREICTLHNVHFVKRRAKNRCHCSPSLLLPAKWGLGEWLVQRIAT